MTPMAEAAARGAPDPGASGDPLWDDWSTPPRVPETPELHLDGYDGPLDLLLDLEERQRIDLGRLSMLALVEQFVASMQRLAGRVRVERRADWLVLATRLLQLRSRLLCPASPQEHVKAQQHVASEEERLTERLRMRAAAAWLEARPQLGHEVFARPQPGPARTETRMALLEACLLVLRGPRLRPDAVAVYRPVLVRLWRVEQALAQIRAMLAEDPQGGALMRFLPEIAAGDAQQLRARGAVAGTLVACLELARQGDVRVEQPQPFDPVRIRLLTDPPIPDTLSGAAI